VTIAAILLFFLGGIQLALSIIEFFRSSISVLPPLGGGSNILWGGLDVLYALVIIYAGYALLRWQTSGRVIALLIVVLLAFRWANYLVGFPWVAVMIVVVCGLIIGALAVSDDPVVAG
jgi:hypothetical protein